MLIEPIAGLVDLEPDLRGGPYGSISHPARSQGSRFKLIESENPGEPPRCIEMTGSYSGQIASIGANSPLHEGCRVLYHRTQSLAPLHWTCRQRIGISSVQIGARSFVSGIDLFLSDNSNVGSRLIGYRNPASEKWMEIPSGSHVEAICVAFCSEGLRGLQFKFSNSESSVWVGESKGPGIAYGTLKIPEKSDQCCLLAGLDRYKIVLLSLREVKDHLEGSSDSSSRDMIDKSLEQSYLWTPQGPKHEGLKISTLLPHEPPREFQALTNIDFGGPNGLLLGSLTSLTFHMTSTPLPLIGIRISYSDRRSAQFGSDKGCELTLFINGPEGERINSIGILEDNREYHRNTGLGGLRVFQTPPKASM